MATITGNNGPNRLRGTNANDILRGLGGNDSLLGLAGNDRLDGGAGNDTMVGGAGNDVYLVNSTGDRVTESARGGTDTVFSSVSFTLGPNVENLVLVGSANISGTGNALNNTLTGNIGRNVLRGLGGNDLISGGTGTDRLEGGIGNDTYVVTCPCGIIIESAGAGTDLIRSNRTFFMSTTAHVENLTLIGAAHLDGNGNSLANVMTGNGGRNALFGALGNDRLLGLGGDDRLDGSIGNDFMAGGAGNDTYVVNAAGDVVSESGGGTDLVISDITFDLGTTPQVENLILSGGGNGTGNALANIITGGDGVNVLSGGAGADTFRFLELDDSPETTSTDIRSDTIADFSQAQNEKIDLRLIDFNDFNEVDDAFTFIGANPFSGVAGQLRYEARTINGTVYTAVQADRDGNQIRDMEILLVGTYTLAAGDFSL
jgi:Ca2+-binding RTX toxin-like protein